MERPEIKINRREFARGLYTSSITLCIASILQSCETARVPNGEVVQIGETQEINEANKAERNRVVNATLLSGGIALLYVCLSGVAFWFSNRLEERKDNR